MGGGFALGGEVGGQNHLLHHAIAGAVEQFFQADVFGADAVKRADAPHQHKVQPLKRPRALQRRLVGGGLDHTQPRGVALGVLADLAHLGFAKRVAALAVAHAAHRLGQRLRQRQRALAVVLQQVKRHARGRLHAHPRQAPQRLHQGVQGVAGGHGYRPRAVAAIRTGTSCHRANRACQR